MTFSMKYFNSTLLHTLSYLRGQLRGHRLQIALNTLLGVLLVGVDLGFVWTTKLAIDIATHHTQSTNLSTAFMLMGLLMMSRIVITIFNRWIRAILGVKAQNDMRLHIFNRLLNSKWTAVRKYHTGNLTNRIERDVYDVTNFVTESIPAFVTTCVQFVGAFLFLFYMDKMLAMIITCIVPFFLLSSKLYVKKMKRLTHDIREKESNIQSLIQETLQHNILVKTLDCFDILTDKLNARQHALHHTVIERTKYATLSSSLLNLGFATGYFVTFAWGATQLMHNHISYGTMLAFVQLVSQIQVPVRTLSRFVPIFINAFTATERLMEMDHIEQESARATDVVPTASALNFERVTFKYEGGSRAIFTDFSFSIPAGSVTVITGETGSGKTTLIRLILALAKPQSGSVSICDTQGNTHPIDAHLRKCIAYVPQGNSLISGTIRSNILLGNPNATEPEIREALTMAGADFVFKKEFGLDTTCGETGDGLSEGQAQRIAIARALVSDRPILIFDEATSALDNATERIVTERIVRHLQGRTLIFITHREEVLKYANNRLHL